MFFNKIKNKFGKLKCQICGNIDLIESNIGNKKTPSNLATIEHITPKSQGGLKYNDINFICTCNKCNNTRGLSPLFQINDEMWVY